MLPVKQARVPKAFAVIRAKGKRWLDENRLGDAAHPGKKSPVPRGTEFPTYWKGILPILRGAYGGICAYTGFFIDEASEDGSVDHYLPKTKYPRLAYAWSNYRFAHRKVNRYKGDDCNIIDPFKVGLNEFIVNFDDGSVEPNPGLVKARYAKVKHTIDALHLCDERFNRLRRRMYDNYKRGLFTADCLQAYCPFVYWEMKRQGEL